MEELEATIQLTERYLRLKKKQALILKAQFSFLLFMGVIYAFFVALGKLKKFHVTIEQLVYIEVGIFLLFLIPILFSPLYHFLSARLLSKLSSNVKRELFSDVLNKYNTDYTLYNQSLLPENEIKLSNIEKHNFYFTYGDDLIIGSINNFDFKLSEIHSGTPFKSKFNGIIAIIYDDSFGDMELFEITPKNLFTFETNDPNVTRLTNVLKQNPNYFEFLRVTESRIIIGINGDDSLFEYIFKRNYNNRENLIKDYILFKNTIELIHQITLSKLPLARS